ncbi:hypothetical protein ODJ79_28940 [Actinoplanes sp. KI2]|uniref:hypothetical protein n=1 Tax=Actinoplanes sp. KI2 TaxID=2983315 RepID=UPI0021D5820F|nr:hypothetical protein [Actinoplanes sp. KI2]MCU7727764.1 hypothetical protein [Actinoplanes sp. KI2]
MSQPDRIAVSKPRLGKAVADLIILSELTWGYWVLPGLLVVAWTCLWWASRSARLWFAGLAPLGAIAVILIGVLAWASPSRSGNSCVETYCRGGGPEDLQTRIAAMGGGPGAQIAVCGLLALMVAGALTIVTYAVETTLLVRRHERAEREAAAADQPWN